jgi:hypothetical protein
MGEWGFFQYYWSAFDTGVLGIKHSEGKRKDGDGMALTVCIPITLSEYDTMLGRKYHRNKQWTGFHFL